MLIEGMGSNGTEQTNGIRNCKWLLSAMTAFGSGIPWLMAWCQEDIQETSVCSCRVLLFLFWATATGCCWRENTGLHGPLVRASVLCYKADKSLVSIFRVPCSRYSRPLQDSWSISRSVHLQGTFNTWHHRTDYQGSYFGCSKRLANRGCLWSQQTGVVS